MATHSSTLAWKIPWMDEAGRLQSMGSQRVGHSWVTSLSFLSDLGCFIFHYSIFLRFQAVYGVLAARILEWFAVSSYGGPRFVRTLHSNPSILGGPAQQSSRLHWVSQAPLPWQERDPWRLPKDRVVELSYKPQMIWKSSWYCARLSLLALSSVACGAIGYSLLHLVHFS